MRGRPAALLDLFTARVRELLRVAGVLHADETPAPQPRPRSPGSTQTARPAHADQMRRQATALPTAADRPGHGGDPACPQIAIDPANANAIQPG